MAGKTDNWDYALRIRGLTPRTMPLGRLGEYIKAYAALLGEGNEPRFAGIVKGSAVLRATISSERKTATHRRLLSVKFGAAANDETLIRAHGQIADLLANDQSGGKVEDRSGAVILEFELPDPEALLREPIVQDTGTIDGVVVGLVGTDDTVHLRLLDWQNRSQKVTVRDVGEARKLARYFRGDMLRVHVHGTWRRNSDGVWEPHALYLDRFEELGKEPASELLTELSALEGNRWAAMTDPQALVRRLRGDD